MRAFWGYAGDVLALLVVLLVLGGFAVMYWSTVLIAYILLTVYGWFTR